MSDSKNNNNINTDAGSSSQRTENKGLILICVFFVHVYFFGDENEKHNPSFWICNYDD